MSYEDIHAVDTKIQRLSELFQKALVSPSGSSTLLGIKRELKYWREQRKVLVTGRCRIA
mgnify:CR=1 FL=1